MQTPCQPENPAPLPYEGYDDAQVLEIAKNALSKVWKLPAGSLARSVQWGIFDAAMAELSRRAMMHVLARIHEREKGKKQ